MNALAYSYENFQDTSAKFEKYLMSNKPKIESFHPYFENALWEMVENGGKRFRPNLLLAIVCACAKEQVFNAFKVCLAIECLHTYSLIHDDLPAMDNASLRRNHQTLHVKYNETAAILAGDGLNTYSFYLLSQSIFAPEIKVALIECLSQNGGIDGMIIGQALDCEFENILLSQDKLEFIHINKTARLIAASLKMGGIIANLPHNKLDFLYDFGIDLGLFFQIRDDIIDYTQDEKEAGKSTKVDSVKNSYVNLMGIDKAKAYLADMTKQIEIKLNTFDDMGLKNAASNLRVLLESYFH